MPATPQPPSPLTLTQQEMRAIGRAISRDFGPRLFQARGEQAEPTRFSPQELREISRQISREYSHSSASRAAQLLLLPVAPGRLHVYWQVDKTAAVTLGSTAQNPPETDAPATLNLRLYPLGDADRQASPSQTMDFDLAGTQGHADLAVAIEQDRVHAVGYRAELGWIDRQARFQPLLVSNPAPTPPPPRLPEQHAATPAIEQSIMVADRASSAAVSSHSGQGKTTSHE